MSGNETETIISGKSSTAVELHWTRSNRPPEVTFAYDGLQEPTHLWEQLEAIGWIVPPRPPRPRTAIEWTPDPVAGTDYTILPWRAEEFEIVAGNWTPEQIPLVNERTFEILKRNRVAISGPSARLEALEAQSEAATESAAPTPPPVATDVPVAPAVVAEQPGDALTDGGAQTRRFLFVNAFEPGEANPAVTHHVGTSGRQRTAYAWSEAVLDPMAIAGDTELLQRVSGEEVYAWTLPDGANPHSTGDGHVRILLLATSSDASAAKKLVKLLGSDVTISDLEPVAANEPAVLLTARVPAGHREMLIANVRLRFKDAIVRND